MFYQFSNYFAYLYIKRKIIVSDKNKNMTLLFENEKLGNLVPNYYGTYI